MMLIYYVIEYMIDFIIIKLIILKLPFFWDTSLN